MYPCFLKLLLAHSIPVRTLQVAKLGHKQVECKGCRKKVCAVTRVRDAIHALTRAQLVQPSADLFQCQACEDYTLCEQCATTIIGLGQHNPGHQFTTSGVWHPAA